MTEPERPPVEPLSDVAWSRVERGVWTELDAEPIHASPRASRTWWLALPLVAAAAVAAVVVIVRSPDRPDHAPTRVTSGASASTVALDDAHITLDPQSAIVMDTEASSVLVERGAAWFAVEPRGSRPPFIVTAGDARVRVVGTRFRVARDAERIEVEVAHGIVEVGFHGELVRVTNGQHWSSTAPHDVIDGQTATAEVPAPPPVVPAPLPVTPTPPPAASHPGHPAPPATEDRDAQRFATLTRLEASDPNAAMKGYLALSKGSSRWAEVSLFAAARLASDRHDPRATNLIQIYLRRFPRGANVADARQLLTHGGQP
ncbi:MAG: FecR family protein [Kofleriaceae bacterium]